MMVPVLLILFTASDVTAGRVFSEYPSTNNLPPPFDQTPDRVFITLLGPDLTDELLSQDFQEAALEAVIRKVFLDADGDKDNFLSLTELAFRMHRNLIINKASDVKGMFTDYDVDSDQQITFTEFALGGGLDRRTADTFRRKYVLPSGGVDEDKLSEDMSGSPRKPGVQGPNIVGIINDFYTFFKETDEDKNGVLNWDEFFSFTHPRDKEELHGVILGQQHRQYDANTDLEYNFDEFDKWYLAHVIIPELVPALHRNPQDMFDTCDEDRSGSVSYTEIDRCTRGYIDHLDTDEMMTLADANKDGKVSEVEMVEAFESLIRIDDFSRQLHDEL